ncbi:MAG: hypothetical protein SF069_08895 [Phycisphaerae bacterium]|nr:hypothetical protein [Phycisphaerae bacterium]
MSKSHLKILPGYGFQLLIAAMLAASAVAATPREGQLESESCVCDDESAAVARPTKGERSRKLRGAERFSFATRGAKPVMRLAAPKRTALHQTREIASCLLTHADRRARFSCWNN